MAEALYRKYRPRTFAEVVGQDTIERTLKNAVAQDKVSHAYLFCGPRGTGKTTSARLLAKALLCEHGPTPEPDGTCADCLDIARGMHPDVYELDAASRTGVDNVREEIIGRVAYAPTRGRYKIYIIDEVHMLSVAAFNALLKTLEEPPAHVVFVLCTTDPQKVPETIQSRCQRFDFRRIGAEEIAGRLAEVCRAEGATADPEALALIARHAKGGMRDALTALEACLAHDGGAVTLEGARSVVGEGDAGKGAALLEAVAVRDVAAAFAWVDAASDAGVDLSAAAIGLAADIRDLYVMAVVGGPRTAENRGGFGLAPARVEALTRVSGAFGADRAARALAVLGDLIAELKTSANPRLSFEIALVRLARPAEDMTLEALAERVEALEMGRAGAVPVSAAAAPVAAAPAPVAVPAPAPSRHPERGEGSFP
ncbi:MAG: DNA polymerase III subunit gamma/tau, partial [Eggerthellaceae bacterium]|nr:DNA polymerase III subunit gamma/tau [Eggerthellaceae bacterium]